MRKRLLGILLIIVLIMSNVPQCVFAENKYVFDNNINGIMIVNIDTPWTGSTLEEAIKKLNLGSLQNITTLNITAGVLTNDDIMWISRNLENIKTLSIIGGASFEGGILQDYAFSNDPSAGTTMSSLRNVTIDIEGEKELHFGNYAFFNCGNLRNVNIAEATTFASYAFGQCSSLTRICLPKLISFDTDAFYFCNQAISMVLGNTPPRNNSIFSYHHPTSIPKILIPSSAVNTYKAVDDGNTSDDYWYDWLIASKSTVISVDVPPNDTYKTGDDLYFTVNFDKNIIVHTSPGVSWLPGTSGVPYILIKLESGKTVKAINLGGSGTPNLLFGYYVESDKYDVDGIEVVGGINTNGAILLDDASNIADLTLNNVASTAGVLIDSVKPTVTITSIESNSTNKSPISITITFSEDVTDFTVDDITVANGTKSDFSGSGKNYNLNITPTGDGNITVDIPGNICHDSVGNNNAAAQFSIVSDRTSPLVSSVSVPVNGTYKEGDNLDFTVNFDDDVTVNTSGGTPFIPITLETGGTVNAEYQSGSGTQNLIFTYTIESDKLDSDGIELGASINVNGGTLQDTSGNEADLTLNSVASTAGVHIDSVKPMVTIISTKSNPTNESLIQLTITFSKDVTGFTVDDITAVNGTKSDFTGSGKTYNLNITPAADGILTVDIPENICNDSLGNTNTAASQFSIVSDRTSPTIRFSPVDDSSNVGRNDNLIMTFNENVEKGIGNIIIKKASDDSIVETIDVTSRLVTGWSSKIIAINPLTTLKENTGYYVQIDGTAIDDSAGNSYIGIGDKTTWNFKTRYIPSYTPSTPNKEEISVDVTDGKGKESISKIRIERTIGLDGKKRDRIEYKESSVRETLERLKKQGKDTARIEVPDKKDEVSEVEVRIPKESLNSLDRGDINLNINTRNVRIQLPKESIESFNKEQNGNGNLFFRVEPIKDKAKQKEKEKRLKENNTVKLAIKNYNDMVVVGTPMQIETNMQSKAVDIVLPLKNELPKDKIERENYLKQLSIFVEHSDGDHEVIIPEIVEYEDGVLGLKFTINKFSTFTIIKGTLEEDKGVYSSETRKITNENKEWKIKFNNNVNEETINSKTIKITEDGKLFETVMEIIKNEVIVKPKNPYKIGKTYNLIIEDEIRNEEGTELNKKIILPFRVVKNADNF